MVFAFDTDPEQRCSKFAAVEKIFTDERIESDEKILSVAAASGHVYRTKPFLRDYYDHAITLIDLLENYREATGNLTELYLSSLSMRTNEIVRVLTVVSSIFIPLTFIAGLYGMNFDTSRSRFNMPELHWKYGYPAVLLLMGLIAGFMLYYFRRKKWL